MKRNYTAIIMAVFFALLAVQMTGCGSSTIEGKVGGSGTAEETTESAEDPDDDEIREDDKDTDKGVFADAEDSTPSRSEPSNLYFLTKDGYIDNILEEYAVNMRDQEFTGDIWEVISAYKGMDLDGDGSPDVIERYGDGNGYGYQIVFSDGGSIDTGVYSSSPNEGEVIEFHDMDGDYTDEILIAHYTGSTAGPMCWQTYLYVRNDKGEWKGYPIIDADNKPCNDDLEAAIEDRGNIRFAGIEMTDEGIAILADFGMKDGPEQTLDYEGMILSPDLERIKEGRASDRDAFDHIGSSKDNALKYWPMDAGAASGTEGMDGDLWTTGWIAESQVE